MKIIFFLPAGVVEWPVPEGLKAQFNFSSVVTSMRVNGFFLGDHLYMRHESIVGMAFAPDDAAPLPVRRDLN